MYVIYNTVYGMQRARACNNLRCHNENYIRYGSSSQNDAGHYGVVDAALLG